MSSFFLLIVSALVFFFPVNVSAHSEVRIIEMTSNGFEPQEVTVDENSSIIFFNKDTKSRWPASNTHPTHELYPEFDPRKPIAPGESWAFKPKETGEWKFHDHLLPHMRGVLTVVKEEQDENQKQVDLEPDILSTTSTSIAEKNSLMDTIKNIWSDVLSKIKDIFNPSKPTEKNDAVISIEDFKKLSYDLQTKELEKIAEGNGAPRAWQLIKNVFAGEGGSSGNIHDLAHLAGILLYEKGGFEHITDCGSEFAFGCYHGFLDKAFAENLDHLPDAEQSCLKLGPPNSGPVASCIHGIGHGVASFYSTNDVEKALVTCRKLASGNEYCFDGVFMEFVRSAPDTFFKSDDPYYPCNSLEEKYGYAYSFSCGRNQPSLLMSRYKKGFDEVVGVCTRASSKPFKNACFESLGFSLAATGDARQIIAGCQKIGEDEFVAKCIKAAAGELVFQEVPGWPETSKEVCSGVSQGQRECLEHIERLIKEYHKQTSFNFRNLKSGEDASSYIREQLQVCYDTGGRDGCYKQAADALYNNLGLAQTLELFKNNEEYPEVYARCHEVTHYLSRLEYEKQGSIANVYAQCDSTCHGGCYHGTMEAYLKEYVDGDANLGSIFSTVCGKSQDYQKPIEFNECLHGMGHAAMFVTDMELMQSLQLCDRFSDQQHKERCYTGVFMENSSSSTSFDHASKYIKADDPFYPCNALEEKYQSLCWQYQSSYFSIISNQDWKKVARLCLQIPGKYHDRCFRTIGTNQVGFTSSLEMMKKDCDLMPSEHFKNVCVAGVVSSLSYRFVGETQKMIDFCSLADLQNRESCFKQIGSGVLDWNTDRDVAKKECQKISDPAGLSWCMSVI
ncbi:MAG: hypothetical protein A2912_01625 [Candidatus Buchananbacteria bacterium RIFCSPLOWO2_01_FULL_40_23b]|uniref:EfeO-type cupredoxin-like domain-containing protein n=1 Tax=Candidatus Buchananbacteria bacterium RIFCSPLOWO2_01_FULL_40_23b TaxID=1797544 RepID=A0A1G1YTB4_9BACT|nr:MAG: hypothetical protein A2912_01625 [Candidatus Buchananbacteria bacterium RIFCSPLOWO2_01_FULL_40_23b]